MARKDIARISLAEIAYFQTSLREAADALEQMEKAMKDRKMPSAWMFLKPSIERAVESTNPAVSEIRDATLRIEMGDPYGPESKKGRHKTKQEVDYEMTLEANIEILQESAKRSKPSKSNTKPNLR
jgi:hypothetical protein